MLEPLLIILEGIRKVTNYREATLQSPKENALTSTCTNHTYIHRKKRTYCKKRRKIKKRKSSATYWFSVDSQMFVDGSSSSYHQLSDYSSAPTTFIFLYFFSHFGGGIRFLFGCKFRFHTPFSYRYSYIASF